MLRRPLALLALALSITTAGCQADSESPGGGDSSEFTSPAATKDLDAITWWVGYRAPYTLDPIQYDDYPEDQIKSNLCEPLVRVAPDFSLHPYIAQKISNPEPTRWVYDIDPDATFWDGSSVTAEDVVFSLERNVAPGSESFYTTPFANVTSIDKTGDLQVTVTMKRPDRTFNDWMATGASMVVKKSFVEEAGDLFGTPSGGLMCTGPFRLEEWNGDDSIEVVASENYWNDDLRPRTKRITFVFPQDAAAVARGFQTGEFDGGFLLPSGSLPALRKTDAGTLHVSSTEQTLMTDNIAVLNLKSGPTADPLVRQALFLAIDRAGISEAIYQGSASPLYAVAPPGFWGYSEKQYASAYEELKTGQDLERAKELVAEAGLVAEEPIEIAVNSGSEERERMAAILQQNAAAVGLTLEIRQLPAEQYGDLFFNQESRGSIDLLLTTSYEAVAEPLIMYTDMATPDGVINYNGYDNPEVTALLNEARAIDDDAERAGKVIKAQELVMADLPWIPVAAPLVTTFLADGVTGAPYTFTMLNSPWAASVGGK